MGNYPSLYQKTNIFGGCTFQLKLGEWFRTEDILLNRTLPETNSSPLKMDGWFIRSFPFGACHLVRCYCWWFRNPANQWRIPSRGLTYPTLGKRKSSSKCHFLGICSLENIPWFTWFKAKPSNRWFYNVAVFFFQTFIGSTVCWNLREGISPLHPPGLT